jgi:hypothetical protein
MVAGLQTIRRRAVDERPALFSDEPFDNLSKQVTGGSNPNLWSSVSRTSAVASRSHR